MHIATTLSHPMIDQPTLSSALAATGLTFAPTEYWAIFSPSGQEAIGLGPDADTAWRSCDETAGQGFDLTRNEMEGQGYFARQITEEQYMQVWEGDIYACPQTPNA